MNVKVEQDPMSKLYWVIDGSQTVKSFKIESDAVIWADGYQRGFDAAVNTVGDYVERLGGSVKV